MDVHPGDRAASCGGMMKPVLVEGGPDEYTLVHKCTLCGFTKRNIVSVIDDMDAVIQIAAQFASRVA